jgi:hypothetical protein
MLQTCVFSSSGLCTEVNILTYHWLLCKEIEISYFFYAVCLSYYMLHSIVDIWTVSCETGLIINIISIIMNSIMYSTTASSEQEC